jgi:hypothetical protein
MVKLFSRFGDRPTDRFKIFIFPEYTAYRINPEKYCRQIIPYRFSVFVNKAVDR